MLGSGGSAGDRGRGVVLGVGEQLESLGMAEEPAESSGVKGGQGEVMFYWEMRGSDPADRSSLRLEFADFRGGLEPP